MLSFREIAELEDGEKAVLLKYGVLTEEDIEAAQRRFLMGAVREEIATGIENAYNRLVSAAAERSGFSEEVLKEGIRFEARVGNAPRTGGLKRIHTGNMNRWSDVSLGIEDIKSSYPSRSLLLAASAKSLLATVSRFTDDLPNSGRPNRREEANWILQRLGFPRQEGTQEAMAALGDVVYPPETELVEIPETE